MEVFQVDSSMYYFSFFLIDYRGREPASSVDVVDAVNVLPQFKQVQLLVTLFISLLTNRPFKNTGGQYRQVDV